MRLDTSYYNISEANSILLKYFNIWVLRLKSSSVY